jgi:hypothetical protein
MPLFEVAILQAPKKAKKDEEDGSETLVLKPTYFLAKSPESAGHKAIIQCAGEADFDIDRAKVIVRPFA